MSDLQYRDGAHENNGSRPPGTATGRGWGHWAKRLLGRNAHSALPNAVTEPAVDFGAEGEGGSTTLTVGALPQGDPESGPRGGAKIATGRKPLAQCMADVQPQEVDWLWYPYFPRGFLTSVEGDPGVSKSTLMCEVAARISRGEPLPGQADRRAPQNVLMLSAEDSLSVTLHQRLVAQDADLTRVFAREEPFALDQAWLKRLSDEIRRTHPALVILDPIVAYMDGHLDIHRANAVRSVLAPLAGIAAAHHCAIVIVRHLSKARHPQALHRGIGSVDFTAAARSALLVAPDKANDQRRIMAHTKCNLAPLGPSLCYRISDGKLMWAGQSTVRADDLGKAGGTKQAQAEDFLVELLAEGAVTHARVLEEATKSGITERTLDRAKKALGVRSMQSRDGWSWALPEGAETDF
jgi:AAA domain